MIEPKKKTLIDIESWDRAENFYIFRDFDMPYTNICADIDITNFMKFIRTKDYSFFATLLYYITKSANIIKEFRYRLEDETPVIWNWISANYTLMRDNGIMGNSYTDYTESLEEFYYNVTIDLAESKKSNKMINKFRPEDEADSVITITSIPWTKLTSFSQAVYRIKNAVPYIGVGKRYGMGERIMLPVALQAHHAFVDGFHISHYFKLLEMMLSNPEKYKNMDIPTDILLKESKPFIYSEHDKPITIF